MPRAGLEPARSFEQRILSPQRLPIPPPGRDVGNMWRLGSEPKTATNQLILRNFLGVMVVDTPNNYSALLRALQLLDTAQYRAQSQMQEYFQKIK